MSMNKKTMCLAPWYNIFLESDNTLGPCCQYKETTQYKFDQIKEYFHSDQIQTLREDLVSGVKNKNCAECWKAEENGGDSLRIQYNRSVARHLDVPLLDQIKNPKLSNVKSFDLTLGNLCNLKCVMCSPYRSSQLLAEVNLNKELQHRYDKPRESFNKKYEQKNFKWPESNDFVQWCKEHLPRSIQISFSGGEPFLNPWINEVLEHIPDSQKSKCILHFTTNLTTINNKLFNSFHKFKEVWISVSVEGIHETHEYLRFGHSWNLLEKNIKNISKKGIPNLIFRVNHVVQTPSYHSITDMTDFFDKLQIQIHPILLKYPKHFQISALTTESKQSFLDHTEEYAGFNFDFIQFVRSVTKKYIEQDKTLTQECINDLTELDRVRNNDHNLVIPKKNLRLY